MKKPKILIMRAPGINCEIETFNTFNAVGGACELAHINKVVSGAIKIKDYSILVFPGGFSYGDDIAGGRIFANRIGRVKKDIISFIKSGRPVIGICNGFQVLAKAGLLPFPQTGEQVSSFTFNDCGHFIGRWEKLRPNKKSKCLFTKNLPDEFELPIANGEGKFVAGSAKILKQIKDKNCIAVEYVNNPNGADGAIAGLTNPEGNCLGIMPHPERFSSPYNHPAWTDGKKRAIIGIEMFKNAVEYVK